MVPSVLPLKKLRQCSLQNPGSAMQLIIFLEPDALKYYCSIAVALASAALIIPIG